MAKKTRGKTATGKPITDELVEKLAEGAEAGYDVEETLRRPGSSLSCETLPCAESGSASGR